MCLHEFTHFVCNHTHQRELQCDSCLSPLSTIFCDRYSVRTVHLATHCGYDGAYCTNAFKVRIPNKASASATILQNLKDTAERASVPRNCDAQVTDAEATLAPRSAPPSLKHESREGSVGVALGAQRNTLPPLPGLTSTNVASSPQHVVPGGLARTSQPRRQKLFKANFTPPSAAKAIARATVSTVNSAPDTSTSPTAGLRRKRKSTAIDAADFDPEADLSTKRKMTKRVGAKASQANLSPSLADAATRRSTRIENCQPLNYKEDSSPSTEGEKVALEGRLPNQTATGDEIASVAKLIDLSYPDVPTVITDEASSPYYVANTARNQVTAYTDVAAPYTAIPPLPTFYDEFSSNASTTRPSSRANPYTSTSALTSGVYAAVQGSTGWQLAEWSDGIDPALLLSDNAFGPGVDASEQFDFALLGGDAAIGSSITHQ